MDVTKTWPEDVFPLQVRPLPVNVGRERLCCTWTVKLSNHVP
jgi:hypothetical protein